MRAGSAPERGLGDEGPTDALLAARLEAIATAGKPALSIFRALA
jgi:hypothetical protein